MDFQDILAQNGAFGGKIGKGWCDVHPNELVLTFGGCYLSARLLLAKIDKKATVRVRTERTHTETEKN